jgi:hypothetical protein
MTIECAGDRETAAVFQRERAGEFRILRMERGPRNASWRFTVSEPRAQGELLAPPLPPLKNFFNRAEGRAVEGLALFSSRRT